MFETFSIVRLILYLTIIALLLSIIEAYSINHRCVTRIDVPKNVVVIEPNGVVREPIYVYNKKKVKRKDIPYKKGFNDKKYEKRKISEHVGSKIICATANVIKGLVSVVTSKTPIDTLYNSLGKSDGVVSNANPLKYEDDSNIRLLVHKKDRDLGFVILNGKIVVL